MASHTAAMDMFTLRLGGGGGEENVVRRMGTQQHEVLLLYKFNPSKTIPKI